MGALDFLFGSKSKIKKMNKFSPEQQSKWEDFWNNGIENSPLYGTGSDFLQNLLGGGQNAFSQWESPLMQNFNQNIAPGIAQRFAGMGTGAGASSSSGLNNSLAQAGSNLQSQLGALRGNLQMQALPQALAYAQQPYSNQLSGFGISPYEFMEQQGQQGLIPQTVAGIAGGVGSGFGQGVGQYGAQKFTNWMNKGSGPQFSKLSRG